MTSQLSTVATARGDEEDCLTRARRLAPVIAGAAERAENERRLPPDLLAALQEARLFRLLLPRPFGGDEVNPATFAETIEAVAKLDGSTAWCLCQGNGCAMTAAYVDPAIAEKIWGGDPAGVLAWGPGKAEAVAEGAGYRVNGTWRFASGARHATWLGGHSTVMEGDGSPRRHADGSIAIRTMLFPANQATMIDVWDVIGLRGTGSDNFTVRDLFVRHDHSVSRDDAAERRYDAPLYQFPATNLYASGFSATALGISRAMLDAFKDLAVEKMPQHHRRLLSDNNVIQSEVAQGEARLGAARAFLLDELTDIWDCVVATGELTIEQRMRIRLATTFAIHEAKTVAETVYDAAGATAIFASRPFERRYRDLRTVTQQVQGRRANFEIVGAYLLGHPPDLSVV